MKIEIDQSGKVENTNKLTALAFSNGECGVIIINSREKKLIQKFFREIKEPKLFVSLTFTALVFILIKSVIKKCHQIIIDREYAGFEKFIHRKLTQFIKENSSAKDFRIFTSEIGKKSKAHIFAYSAYNKKSKIPVRKITAQEIIKIILKNKRSGNA